MLLLSKSLNAILLADIVHSKYTFTYLLKMTIK